MEKRKIFWAYFVRNLPILIIFYCEWKHLVFNLVKQCQVIIREQFDVNGTVIWVTGALYVI